MLLPRLASQNLRKNPNKSLRNPFDLPRVLSFHTYLWKKKKRMKIKEKEAVGKKINLCRQRSYLSFFFYFSLFP